MSRILKNVASNWVGFAVNAAATLAVTPFVLRQLGPAGYGIWILSSSVIGYYGFLDLGFRAGVTQYLTRYLAAGDRERASECLSSGIAAMSVVGVVLAILSIGAAFLVPHVFDIPSELERDAFWCVLIVGISAGIQFALQPFGSIFTARQRFDLANAIGIMTRLLTVAGIVTALSLGYGLVGLSLATCLASTIDYIIRWRVSRRLAALDISRTLVSLERMKEIASFGIWNFLVSITSFVYTHVPNLLIGFFMPMAAVGHYALAVGLSRQLSSALGPVHAVVYPAAAALDVKGDRAGLERLYHNGSRLMLLATVSAAVLAYVWAPDFYRLWVGDKYLTGEYPSVATLFRVLLIGVIANFSSIAWQILAGAGHIRVGALTTITGSAINLCLSAVLISSVGLLGAPLTAVTLGVAIDGIASMLLVQRYVGLSALSMLRNAYPRPLLVLVLQFAAVSLIHRLGHPNTWIELIVIGGLTGIVCAVIVVAVGTTRDERNKFVFQPLLRLRRSLI